MKDNNDFMDKESRDFSNSVTFTNTTDFEDDIIDDINESLKRQIREEMDHPEGGQGGSMSTDRNRKKRKKKSKAKKILLGVLFGSILILALLIGTHPGRKVVYGLLGNYLHGMMQTEDVDGNLVDTSKDEYDDPSLRKEEYVKNYLIMGIEQINGGGRTDSMMIVSINTKDNTVKLSSLLRDTYVSIPGHKNNKLNAAYGLGGADLLIDTIEQSYKIKIEGYASVNFESFEKIIDRLGGVNIELGAKEASYLNRTNYISNPAYRNVKEGWNTLNGNQALGYCRVRKVETLGGANSDYGRTLRQRRVLNAIFDKYKSSGLIEIMSITKDCLKYITTDLSSNEITSIIESIVENGITTMDTSRFPVNDLYTSTRNEVGAVLIPDWDANIKELYKFIYLDQDETVEVTPTGTQN
ncbi:LCP family protein [Clostridium sp. Marseille-P299]|uniref:LCP family protein n=1 Tax=Clostridium sp. Marseille-P299 TaxID=1805477 RepID=UPI000836DBCF|nr:LCP family protein [Clostridium sp. Marseille-P299]